MTEERIRMRLNIMRMKDFPTRVVLKAPKHEPFVAHVVSIQLAERTKATLDSAQSVLRLQVTFDRLEKGTFPGGATEGSWSVLVRDVRSVDRQREE